ncbi:MAG TPA: MaoC/PaaZ C-terminal domain-containing protein [Methylomirabilota bacterium]|jgi:acyl dehydratase
MTGWDDVRTIPGVIVGTEVGALSTTLDARWLMAYAAALGIDDPRYYDTLAEDGPVAHPLFAVCYEWPAVLALRSKAVRESWALLGVHSTHHVVIHRLPSAADRLLTRAQIIVARPSRAGTLVMARLSTVDRNGRPVTTTDYGSVYRGITTEAEVRAPVEPLARPSPPVSAEIRWTAAVPVAGRAAHVYSECARIWNPIHTDIAVARSAGLIAPILHGSATLALAVSQLITNDLDGDPTRVREIAVRFTGLVFMPSTFTVRGRGRSGDLLAFDAVDERGEPVLSDGVLRA